MFHLFRKEYMDKMFNIEESVVNATVGLYPLIVVDPINSCCSEKFERPEWNIRYSKIRQMIPRLRKFTDEYRKIGGQIIWVRATPWTEEFLPGNINRLYHENPHATFYTQKDVGESVEFYKGISVQVTDKVFTKNTYSAFADPHLQRFIKKQGADTILISGVFAEGCVNATIVDGFTKGFFTIILSDLVETMDDIQQQAHKKHLLTHQWPLMYGHVMTSNEFLKNFAQFRS